MDNNNSNPDVWCSVMAEGKGERNGTIKLVIHKTKLNEWWSRLGNPATSIGGRLNMKKFELKSIPISKGLFATEFIKRGEVIAKIKGKIVSAFTTKDKKNVSRTGIDLDKGNLLEPNYPFKEINHSCDPNCTFEEFNDKKGIVILQALRRINKYEELRVDYGWEKEMAIHCVCGSKKCRGIIKLFSRLP